MNVRVDQHEQKMYRDIKDNRLFLLNGHLYLKIKESYSIVMTRYNSMEYVSSDILVIDVSLTRYDKRWSLSRFSLRGRVESETNSWFRMQLFKFLGRFLIAETRVIDNSTGEHSVI